ncbi:hypothetical protein B0H16DRAFT_1566111 [Mycena metata]|uniref:UBC core domain-containing protein n=1 Tax=Mycena metata TaxID=1033252 RepID=A0AAD7IFX2_9AGAR|nr:hypothetical protein B0H16DRAFT_1566111 [Mycena metata]
MMSNWNGTIIGPGHTVHENRIYRLREVPGCCAGGAVPSRLNLPLVSATTGTVDPARLPALASWARASSLEHVLVDIRKEMASPVNRKLPQPPEGSMF